MLSRVKRKLAFLTRMHWLLGAAEVTLIDKLKTSNYAYILHYGKLTYTITVIHSITAVL